MRAFLIAEDEMQALQALDTQAARDVIAERLRMVSEEGFTLEHDDQHADGELAAAAASYAFFASLGDDDRANAHYVEPPPGGLTSVLRCLWAITGWSWRWWKPKSRRRDLVRAGALILAEIERLDRASAKTPGVA